MGQKVHPHGFRVGITEGWSSRWYAPKAAYGEFLTEDNRIREFVERQLNRQPPYAAVARTDIERTSSEVKVLLHTARPGLVIGAKGAEVDKLKENLEDLIDRKVSVNIMEIKFPDLNAQLVSEGIAEQLKKRGSFRRVIKQRCEATMSAGAKGIKIKLSGRLGGAEMARKETQIRGSIPLHTLQANVQYGFTRAVTKTGTIGVKVWLYLGRYGEEVEGKEGTGGSGTRAGGRRFKRG
ncbi:MAG: 30S ribosomal protein S3 [Phycisphaerae bacterium]